MFKRYQQIHFVGIGGAGMSGIAEILLNLGYRVTGSDARRNDAVERLEQLGAKVFTGHDAAHIEGAHVVVYSSAVPRDNAELQAARQRAMPVIPRVEKRVVTYGLESGADLVARGVRLAGMTSRFEVYGHGALLGECTLAIPGRHNVLNALAAVGVGLDLEIPFVTIQKALAAFAGVQRRFQVRGTADGVTVVDDYGHHPAEIRATLAAAKAGFDARVVTVFQPHRHTRTKHLFDDFLTAFNQADVLVVMDIYGAGEASIEGVSAAALAEGIRAHGHRNVTYLGGDRARVVAHVCEITRPGDIVLTLGAGDVGQLGPEILRRLETGSDERRPQC